MLVLRRDTTDISQKQSSCQPVHGFCDSKQTAMAIENLQCSALNILCTVHTPVVSTGWMLCRLLSCSDASTADPCASGALCSPLTSLGRRQLASLEQQRRELERRERSLLEDRAQLEDRLRETAERQLLLERLQRERGGQVRDQRRQLEQLAAANSSLSDRLDTAAGLGSPASTGHTSLHHELDSSADEGIGSGEAAGTERLADVRLRAAGLGVQEQGPGGCQD